MLCVLANYCEVWFREILQAQTNAVIWLNWDLRLPVKPAVRHKQKDCQIFADSGIGTMMHDDSLMCWFRRLINIL